MNSIQAPFTTAALPPPCSLPGFCRPQSANRADLPMNEANGNPGSTTLAANSAARPIRTSALRPENRAANSLSPDDRLAGGFSAELVAASSGQALQNEHLQKNGRGARSISRDSFDTNPKPFRITSLRETYDQVPWNDILAKNRGVGAPYLKLNFRSVAKSVAATGNRPVQLPSVTEGDQCVIWG